MFNYVQMRKQTNDLIRLLDLLYHEVLNVTYAMGAPRPCMKSVAYWEEAGL